MCCGRIRSVEVPPAAGPHRLTAARSRPWAISHRQTVAASASGHGGRLSAPGPDLKPDQVVLAQLGALQKRDSKRMMKFATPAARAEGLFEHSAVLSNSYRMLVGHHRSEMLGVLQTDEENYEVWVRVWGMEALDLTRVPATSSAIFIWKLTRAIAGEGSPVPGEEGCWLTACIQREEIEPDPRQRWCGLA